MEATEGSSSRLPKVAHGARPFSEDNFDIFQQMYTLDIFIPRLMVYYCSAINSAHKDLITMMKEQLVLVSISGGSRGDQGVRLNPLPAPRF